MTTHQLVRKKYIDFFTDPKRKHKEIPSAPLVPENDPTTLFTSSGMQPLVPYLLGEPHPLGTRLVNSQKSFRAQDIEEIGDNRHTTFFEMLGNWSLGDYFKKEQLPWFFEFLTKELGLDPERLYVTVFEGNDEVPKDTDSIEIWKDIFTTAGMKAEVGKRIRTYPAGKNWWSRSGPPENMPPGEPGGPDSEVFYEFTHIEHDPAFGETCHPNCDCGRYMEIGNSVFMQYKKESDGTLKELPKKNVDFGGGLERLVAAANNNPDVFQTNIFNELRENMLRGIENIIRTKQNPAITKINQTRENRIRIFLDHSRASVFLLSEGLNPGKNDRESVLRRLIRRADDQLRLLNLDHEEYWNAAINHYKKTYEGIYSDSWNVELILSVIIRELKDYGTVFKNVDTIHKNLSNLLHSSTSVSSASISAGPIIFQYQSTYGVPFSVIDDLILPKLGLDQELVKESYQKEMNKHREISRAGVKQKFAGGLADHSEQVIKYHTATHLLQQALRDVLGDHVRQRGSNITAERLRFDFSHMAKVVQEEIDQVEKIVNEQIKANLPVSMTMVSLEDAKKQGALFVEGAKFPDTVKVYTMGTYSREICGGPHVDFTGALGHFKIIKEEAAGNQIRRIYATLS